MKVDYNAPAELYIPTARPGRRGRPIYRRFGTAAQAIRFAMEDLPAIRSFGPWMQVGDYRFSSKVIQGLYESSDYPLKRRNEKARAQGKRDALRIGVSVAAL
jgi:hypothetical protein